jgi:hypothetical protein
MSVSSPTVIVSLPRMISTVPETFFKLISERVCSGARGPQAAPASRTIAKGSAQRLITLVIGTPLGVLKPICTFCALFHPESN